jgi:hypothetical protein
MLELLVRWGSQRGGGWDVDMDVGTAMSLALGVFWGAG